MLSGFDLHRKTGEDELVRRVTVMYESNGNVRVRFQVEGNPMFSAEVRGLWLPESTFIGSTKDVTLEYEPGQPVPDVEVGLNAFALVGFDFEFTNGAHKLNKIGIRYAPPNLVPRFADQNTDDPWRVRIKYAKIE